MGFIPRYNRKEMSAEELDALTEAESDLMLHQENMERLQRFIRGSGLSESYWDDDFIFPEFEHTGRRDLVRARLGRLQCIHIALNQVHRDTDEQTFYETYGHIDLDIDQLYDELWAVVEPELEKIGRMR